MVQMYNKTPSQLMKIGDDYVAYCLDEAIAEFIYMIKQEEKPRFEIEHKIRNKNDNPGLKLLMT